MGITRLSPQPPHPPGLITGVAGIAAGIIAAQSNGVFQVGQLILGTIHAPLLGLFILGMCVPYANKIVSPQEGALRDSGAGFGCFVVIFILYYLML